MELYYTFSDVLIKPKCSDILSRKSVNVGTILHNIELDLPIISANMKTVTGSYMANTMDKYGGLGILHRFFNDIQDYKNEVTKIESNKAVSIGVQESDKKLFEELYIAGARIFCIDIAHGHHILMKNMLNHINNILVRKKGTKDEVTIIAGNVATSTAFSDLIDWGADVIKVGIGPGHACHTRKNTGVGVPQLSALEEIYNFKIRNKISYNNPIIADGGCTSTGDICKALKFADAVMLGSMLAGFDESNGQLHKSDNGQLYKIYSGSSSHQSKQEIEQTTDFIEGTTLEIPYKGSVIPTLKGIKEGIQSAFSYVGASNMYQFKKNCEFIHISSGAQKESKL